jgi:hypothetical protein
MGRLEEMKNRKKKSRQPAAAGHGKTVFQLFVAIKALKIFKPVTFTQR